MDEQATASGSDGGESDEDDVADNETREEVQRLLSVTKLATYIIRRPYWKTAAPRPGEIIQVTASNFRERAGPLLEQFQQLRRSVRTAEEAYQVLPAVLSGEDLRNTPITIHDTRGAECYVRVKKVGPIPQSIGYTTLRARLPTHINSTQMVKVMLVERSPSLTTPNASIPAFPSQAQPRATPSDPPVAFASAPPSAVDSDKTPNPTSHRGGTSSRLQREMVKQAGSVGRATAGAFGTAAATISVATAATEVMNGSSRTTSPDGTVSSQGLPAVLDSARSAVFPPPAAPAPPIPSLPVNRLLPMPTSTPSWQHPALKKMAAKLEQK